MSATIKDVAKKAKVAVSTVSLVMNGKGPVSKDTEQKVLKAIEELHYHPQRSARGLATKRSGNFGFILSGDHFSHAEPFYTKIFLGTEFEARAYDYYILLTTIEPKVTNHNIPRFLLERNVDGVILAGTVPTEIVEYIHKNELPIVLIDYFLPQIYHSTILIDNEMGIRLVIDHLLELGHRKIAFIGGDVDHPSMQVRCATFISYLQQKGIEVSDTFVECMGTASGNEAGFEAANRLLDRKLGFTAIVAANDAMAVGTLRACRDRKITIPDEMAVTGFDNVESSIAARPTLTTVHVPKEEMGAAAVRHLVDVINGKSSQGVKTVLPVKLVVRESTLGNQPMR